MQKNFFVVKAGVFCLWPSRCFGFWVVFLALFESFLWCGSAWFVVRFNMVMRDYWHVGDRAGSGWSLLGFLGFEGVEKREEGGWKEGLCSRSGLWFLSVDHGFHGGFEV